jgi:hypothetical protein
MFRNIELSIYDKNDEMNTIGSSSDELALGIEQFANLAHVKPGDVLKKLGIKEKSGYAIGVWSYDLNSDSLKEHFYQYSKKRQSLLSWSELFRIFPEAGNIDWDKVLKTYHMKRIKFLGNWVNNIKLFIIRNDHPEDLDLLKPYIDDYTVVLTWKELLLKLNTDFNKIYEYYKQPAFYEWVKENGGIWDAGYINLVFPDNVHINSPLVYSRHNDINDIAETWTDFLNTYPKAAYIEWDKEDLPVKKGYRL